MKNEHSPLLHLQIEGKKYEWKEQYITGLQVKELAGLPKDTDLFLSISAPWKDESIPNDKEVDLARPGIEYFYVRKMLKLVINGKEFTWPKQYITGQEVKELASIPIEDALLLRIEKPWEDEAITNETRVDLARPGIEHFYSIAAHRKVSIYINNREFKIDSGEHLVSELKQIGGVSPAYELEQLINGELTPLADHGKVEICGGEQFFSHVRDGSSS